MRWAIKVDLPFLGSLDDDGWAFLGAQWSLLAKFLLLVEVGRVEGSFVVASAEI